ncbi:MAG: DUF935 family protein [Weeksellaceae bacterium]
MAQNAKIGKQRKIYTDLVDKTISLTRQDISKWKTAWQNAINSDHPIRYLIYNLYESDVLQDALLSSQLENRRQATLGATFNLLTNNTIDEKLTEEHQNTELFGELISQILNTRFFGHSLLELDWDETGKKLMVNLIPRQNVLPTKGVVVKDYVDNADGVKYRELPEFGTWILEFGKNDDIGILNKAVPHILFKKFAQSCWSELAEIYGIPPRVYKTDTQDPQALARGKRMMTDMGSAAWFIIDTTEEFDWAKGVSTNGDVYNNLIRLSDNQISLLIQGAIIGQDTEHGSYGKDAAGINLLDSLIMADMAMVEMYMNSKVMPALEKIGVVPVGTTFKFEIAENASELWKMTVEALPYYDIDPEWVKDKFGIEVTGKREINAFENQLNASESFFV